MSELIAHEVPALPAVMTIDWYKAADLPQSELRAMIKHFEEWCLLQPQAEIPLKHHFSKGIYVREIFIPKGTALVGKIHKHKNMTIIAKGDVSFLSTDGVMRLRSGESVVSSPGVKRVIVAHEDTIWMTVHENPTDERDVQRLEDELIAKTYDEVQGADIEIKKIEVSL
jgi:quercetin dioxygenase-like cupin family protein